MEIVNISAEDSKSVQSLTKGVNSTQANKQMFGHIVSLEIVIIIIHYIFIPRSKEGVRNGPNSDSFILSAILDSHMIHK